MNKYFFAHSRKKGRKALGDERFTGFILILAVKTKGERKKGDD